MFQFLGRNSGRSDGWYEHMGFECEGSFNSSVGILVVRTASKPAWICPSGAVSIPRSEFWSFGPRLAIRPGTDAPASFNSSVGILVVRTNGSATDYFELQVVSIPRSEFWSFGRDPHHRATSPPAESFNSSVGILVVRTAILLHNAPWRVKFQFLGRNSGRSDAMDGKVSKQYLIVSIPRSEFWSFGHEPCAF